MGKKYFYDKKSDSLYISLKSGLEDSFEEIAPGINIELDEKGAPLGIEILKASRFFEKEKAVIKAR